MPCQEMRACPRAPMGSAAPHPQAPKNIAGLTMHGEFATKGNQNCRCRHTLACRKAPARPTVLTLGPLGTSPSAAAPARIAPCAFPFRAR